MSCTRISTALRDPTWNAFSERTIQEDNRVSVSGSSRMKILLRLESCTNHGFLAWNARNQFSPIPIACSSPRQTSVCKTFGFPRTRISSANSPGSLFAECKRLKITGKDVV
jgi:hypothetical protein